MMTENERLSENQRLSQLYEDHLTRVLDVFKPKLDKLNELVALLPPAVLTSSGLSPVVADLHGTFHDFVSGHEQLRARRAAAAEQRVE